MNSEAENDGIRWALLVLIACLAMGIGSLWGAAYGFLSVATAMFFLLLVAGL